MKLYAQFCEACVFCKLYSTVELGWCEFHNIIVELNRRCENFLPKRKYKGEVAFYIPESGDL